MFALLAPPGQRALDALDVVAIEVELARLTRTATQRRDLWPVTEAAAQLVGALTAAMRDELAGLDWMSAATRQRALAKLARTRRPSSGCTARCATCPAFAEAFRCAPGTPMRPAKPCSVW